LWQPRFFDHAIRTIERYHHFVDYIHMNPVRRDLVRRPEDWAWSSIHSYIKQETPLLTIDMLNLPLDSQARLF
ncbi:MAG TPA: hypothetical protein VMW38_09985, partial [Terriglobia bacterium]|nr:hypothetical protein [Terriglobia bacterium]